MTYTTVDPNVTRTTADHDVTRTTADHVVNRTTADHVVNRTTADHVVNRTTADRVVNRTTADRVVNHTEIPEPTTTTMRFIKSVQVARTRRDPDKFAPVLAHRHALSVRGHSLSEYLSSATSPATRVYADRDVYITDGAIMDDARMADEAARVRRVLDVVVYNIKEILNAGHDAKVAAVGYKIATRHGTTPDGRFRHFIFATDYRNKSLFPHAIKLLRVKYERIPCLTSFTL